MKENIILIGFMGSGKTTVGKKIATSLGYSFLDTDELIVKRAGMEITDIFETQGETAFRKMESELLKELNATVTHAVISTGGGLPLRKENAQLLRTLGLVNYLKVTKEVVLKRLKGDTSRPLLAGENVEEKIEQLLTSRDSVYQSVCHIEINAENGTPEQVAERVISNFNKNIL
ncbi:MAG: shikimate kinase [bacterium]|nr:shikimate kinase [bacterium]